MEEKKVRARDKDARFAQYWKNPDAVRERNRAYYYTSRGLAVPEKRTYTLRRSESIQTAVQAALKEEKKRLEALEKRLEEREAALKFREEQVIKIENTYTIRSYKAIRSVPKSKTETPVCAVGSAQSTAPAPDASPSFVVTF